MIGLDWNYWLDWIEMGDWNGLEYVVDLYENKKELKV